MKKNLFAILAVVCVFGLGLVTTVGTGADDVIDALGIDRTVDFDETVDVTLPAIQVEGTAPVGAIPSRSLAADILEDTNCTETATSINALIAGIDWASILDDVSGAGFTVDQILSVDLNELNIDYTLSWVPDTQPIPEELTCTFSMSGELGDAEIPPFTLATASGTIDYVTLGIDPADELIISSYLSDWTKTFTYCASCEYDFQPEGITSYTVNLEVQFNADVSGSGTVSLD
jgi:hypothetical protein